MSKKHITMAIAYDFDGTLAKGFTIRALSGVEVSDFKWNR